MPYPPAHYQCTDHDLLVATARQFPLASLVSVLEGEAKITHLPLVYYPAQDGQAEHFIGHLDRRNPQTASVKSGVVQAVFHGPTVFISPNDYQRKSGRLPTYNYVKVHVSGQLQEIVTPAEVQKSLLDLNRYLDRTDTPWDLAPDNELMHHFMPHIVTFKMRIDSWEGKFKLSQDKPRLETERTWEKLLRHNAPLDATYAKQLKSEILNRPSTVLPRPE